MAEQPLSPEEGFASILERYEKMVYGFALARTGSQADADDVFQEVFLAYFQCGKPFREEEHRRAWLLRTTLNFSRRVTASPWRRRVLFHLDSLSGINGELRPGIVHRIDPGTDRALVRPLLSARRAEGPPLPVLL